MLEMLTVAICVFGAKVGDVNCVKAFSTKPMSAQECKAKEKQAKALNTGKPEEDGSVVYLLSRCTPVGEKV